MNLILFMMSLNIFFRVIIFVVAIVAIIILSLLGTLMILRNQYERKDRKKELRGIEGTVVSISEETLFEIMGIGAVANRVIVEDNHGYRITLWDLTDDIVFSGKDSGLFVVRGDTITGFERF